MGTKWIILILSLLPPLKLGAVNMQSEEEPDEENILSQFSEEEMEEIEKIKRDPALYNNVVKSIAPSVFGILHLQIFRLCSYILCLRANNAHKQEKDIYDDV